MADAVQPPCNGSSLIQSEKKSTMVNTQAFHHITCSLSELKVMHSISEETHFPDAYTLTSLT